MTLDEALRQIQQLLSERGSITNGELVTAVGDDLDLARQVRGQLLAHAVAADEGTRLVCAGADTPSGTSSPEPEGAWIFVSHSHRDLDEVRRVRNALEAKGHNPLLFFLRCLDDSDELDELIKREIEARTWFLLCDSPNARSSRWVQMELDYIRQFPDKYTTNLDLTHEWDRQLEAIVGLSRRVTVFMAYARHDLELVKPIAEGLKQREYRVWLDTEVIQPGRDWETAIEAAIQDAVANGFVLVFISPNSMREGSLVRSEIDYALLQGGMVIPIVISPDARLPLALQRLAYLDFTTGSFDDNMARLLEALKTSDTG